MSTIKTDNLTSTDGLKTIDVSALIDEIASLRSDLTTAEAQIVTNTGNIVSISDPGIATAWVNFNGSDAVIRDSYNISTVTRTATGQYTITFSIIMDRSDYSWGGAVGNEDGTTTSGFIVQPNATSTTSQMFVRVVNDASTTSDKTRVMIQVFGGKN